MSEFGVHSEVGKLRKVMVHRPELSLQRLTPSTTTTSCSTTCSGGRAQYGDQFVDKMRAHGVEVYLFRDLLAEALAASDEGRKRLVELAASEYTVGVSWSMVRDTLWGFKPDVLAKHRQRPDCRRSGHRSRRVTEVFASGSRSTTPAPSSCHPSQHAVHRDSSCWICRGSRSTRCTGPPAGSRRTTWP
jgi:arginine deiminase